MSRTVWDFEEEAGTPDDAGPVSGRLPPDSTSGVGLGIFADLALHIGNLGKQVQRMQDRYDQIAASIPADYQNAAAAAYPASGTLALDLGVPAQGTFWEVRRLIIGGSDITTSPAGTGWVFVQGSQPNAAGTNPSIAQAADQTTGTLPQKAFYGTHELVVNPGEHLWVIITGGTSGVQYVASFKAEVFDLSARATIIE